MTLPVVFFGTAELACASLAALAAQPNLRLLGVVTQPDRPKGRDLKVQPTPVKNEALNWGLPVFQPERARHSEFVDRLRELGPELIVVAAYGQILPSSILEIPKYGCLNVHTSLLPKYRGAAPIQWAILNGDSETGVTIMKMDVGMDTGDILSQETTPIRDDDNAQTLHDRLARLGAELLVQTIPDWLSGRIVPRKQSEEQASYARKITKEDGRLDWKLPARVLWNRIRGLTPWPGAFSYLVAPDGKKQMLKLWRAEVLPSEGAPAGRIVRANKAGIVVGCGEGCLGILELQKEGGRRLNVQEFVAGHDIASWSLE